MNQENCIIDGKLIALSLENELKLEVDQFFQNTNVKPKLSVIILGNVPASVYYVRMIEKNCAKVHVQFEKYELAEETPEKELLGLIDDLNRNPEVHGIMIQTPLPKQVDQKLIQFAVNPDKDVDCFNPVNMGKLVLGNPGFLPCTPSAVCEILKRENISTNGKHVVIIGRSSVVGKPLALMLLLKQSNANATVTVCHSATPNLSDFTRSAEIVVAAAGRPELVKGNMIQQNTVVIDVGTNDVNGKLTGDVAFEEVSRLASKITPVPGGVGPVTNMILMQNLIKAAKNQLY